MTKTRYYGLGFEKVGRDWRLFDITERRPAAIGPFYATKDELLSDLSFQAEMRGFHLR